MKKYIKNPIVYFLSLIWFSLSAFGQVSLAQEGLEFRELWHVKVNAKFEGRPAIDGDHLYVGGSDGMLRKLNRATGEELWAYNAGAEIGSSITVDEERAYFAAWDGSVQAVWKSDGNLAWSFKTGGEKQWDTWDHRLSTPIVDHERIYFGSGDHHIYGLNKRNGSFRWKVETGGIIHSQPALDGDRIIVGSFDGKLYGVDRANGTVLWTFKTVGNSYFRNGAISSSPLIQDGVAYFGSRDYNLYAVLTATGTGAWNYRTPSWVVAQPLITEDNIYVAISDSPRLISVNKASGRENWNTPLNKNAYGRAVNIDWKYTAVAAQDGRVYLVNNEDGIKVSFYDSPSAKLNRDEYYEGDNFKRINYQSFQDYETRHYIEHKKMGAISSGLVSKDNIIYFSNSGGDVVALEVRIP